MIKFPIAVTAICPVKASFRASLIGTLVNCSVGGYQRRRLYGSALMYNFNSAEKKACRDSDGLPKESVKRRRRSDGQRQRGEQETAGLRADGEEKTGGRQARVGQVTKERGEISLKRHKWNQSSGASSPFFFSFFFSSPLLPSFCGEALWMEDYIGNSAREKKRRGERSNRRRERERERGGTDLL